MSIYMSRSVSPFFTLQVFGLGVKGNWTFLTEILPQFYEHKICLMNILLANWTKNTFKYHLQTLMSSKSTDIPKKLTDIVCHLLYISLTFNGPTVPYCTFLLNSTVRHCTILLTFTVFHCTPLCRTLTSTVPYSTINLKDKIFRNIFSTILIRIQNMSHEYFICKCSKTTWKLKVQRKRKKMFK